MILKGKTAYEFLRPGCICYSANRCSSVPKTVDSSQPTSYVTRSKVQKQSFMKNTFAGLFDRDLLHFSSSKSAELPEVLKHFSQSVKKELQGKSCPDQLKLLAESGFFSLNDLKSDDVKATNLLHLYEDLDLDPSLSMLLEIHSAFIIPTFKSYGSSEQKDVYLNKLMKGGLTGAWAVSEESGGCDPTSMNMTAREEDDGSYILNGTKLWVSNAVNADFFIVLANVPFDNLKRPDGNMANEITGFIVDNNDKVHKEKHELVGLNECDVYKLNFTNVLVSSDRIIGPAGKGNIIAAQGLQNSKNITLICILNQLKKILSDTVVHVSSRKQFPRDLRDNEVIKEKLTNVVSVCYVLESMLYFTSDLLDRYEIDTSVESALLQIYGLEEGLNALSLCMELLGSKSYDKNYPYEKLRQDLKGLSLLTTTQLTRLYATLISLEHAGKILGETIKSNRHPFNFPLRMWKKMNDNQQFMKDKIKLTLQLYKEIHPSLKDSADELEKSVLVFRFIVESIFSRHGAEIIFRHVELNRLSEIALNIFAMTSVLSRASHSYCTGVQNCDQEILLARSVCYKCYKNVKGIVSDVTSLQGSALDLITMNISANTLKNKSYFLAHPLEHDI